MCALCSLQIRRSNVKRCLVFIKCLSLISSVPSVVVGTDWVEDKAFNNVTVMTNFRFHRLFAPVQSGSLSKITDDSFLALLQLFVVMQKETRKSSSVETHKGYISMCVVIDYLHVCILIDIIIHYTYYAFYVSQNSIATLLSGHVDFFECQAALCHNVL